MANLRLRKTILEVVDKQLKANDPPCTKDTYKKLLNAGYSRSEAKDKIGAVVLTEIYDIMKEKQAFDEEKYRSSLEEMLRQSIDYEDSHHIETEWDQWEDLIQKGYDCLGNQEESIGKWGMDEDIFFDEFTTPKQVPIVKEKKIYPNDPCPCGSGKKHKKCCGKK